ncbi:unnamed protein product, partial [Effrenium voratum]
VEGEEGHVDAIEGEEEHGVVVPPEVREQAFEVVGEEQDEQRRVNRVSALKDEEVRKEELAGVAW